MVFKNKTQKYINNDFIFKKIEKYVELIELHNQKMNLTGYSGDKLWEEGIYQSLLLLNQAFEKQIKNSQSQKQELLDIGAGAGFPSLPFYIQHQDKINLTIYEPMTKRVNFLEIVKRELNIEEGFNIKKTRAEESSEIEFFDLITARAVSELKNLIEISHNLGKLNSQFSFLKSLKLDEELEKSKLIIKKFNIKNVDIKEVIFNEKNHKIVSYYKEYKTPKGYPRKWAQIIKD